MFTHGLRTLDSIPSTQHALFQHAKHALLTVAFVWKQSLYKKKTKIPGPSECGWKWNDRTKEWVPYWTDLATVGQVYLLLLHTACVFSYKETVSIIVPIVPDSAIAHCASFKGQGCNNKECET